MRAPRPGHRGPGAVFSVEEADGVHFITMELVEGRTLAKVLSRSGFSRSELLEIAIPLADAVSTAHRKGLGRIIHRCLAKDPDRRYQTALDLRNELVERR